MNNKKIFGVKTEILENGLLYYDDNHKVKITFNISKEGKVLNKTKSSLYIEKFNNEDDIELVVKDNSVKENVIINKQKESYRYIYSLELDNLILKEKDKQYFFLDKTTKEEVFKLSEFIMFDSNKKESKNIKVKVKEIDEFNIVLEVIPSDRWMNSKVRKYPVVLDPSIESVSTDFITFSSSNYQTLINEQGLGRVGIISSVSHSLTIQVNLEGVMNEIERRGKKDTNYKVLLKLPFINKTNIETGVFLLSYSSVNSKCMINAERVLTFDITNIIKDLYLSSYRIATFTLSHASSTLSGSDYIDILVNETNDNKEPSLILNYELDDAPFETKEEFTQEAGTTFIDLYSGRFIHKKMIGQINHNALSIPLSLVFNSNLIFDKSVDTKEKHLIKGWKTNLHQYIKKTGQFIDPLKTYTIHYIDGDGFSHFLMDRWYYEENNVKKYVNKSNVFVNEEGEAFTLVGTIQTEVKCECTNDEGLVYISNISSEEVVDIIIDKNKNILGFDKNGRLIMIQDCYRNTINVLYGTLNNKNKIMSVESDTEKIVFEYDDNDLLCRIIDQYGRTIKLVNGSINGYNNSMTLFINENKYQFINASNLYYIDDTFGKIKRLYISNNKVNKIEEYYTGNVDEENNPFTGTQDKGNIYTYTYNTGLTTEVITKFHNTFYSKTNSYEFDSAGRLIKSKNHRDDYVINEYSGKNLAKEYFFNKTNDLLSDITSSGISTEVSIDKTFNTTGLFAYVVEHDDITKAKNIKFNIEVYKINNDGSYTLLTNTLKSYFEVDNTIICAFKVPKGYNLRIKPYNSTTIASDNITAMYIVRVNGNEYNYDKKDHLIKSSSALSETIYEDYQNDNPTKVTTIDLEHNDVMITKYNYDSNNRLTYSEDYLGNVIEYLYDKTGELIEKKTYNKKEPTLCTKEKFEYDDKGNMISLDGVMKDKDETIPSTEIEYCKGLKFKIKSPSGKVTTYGYDFNTDNLLSLSSEVDGISHVNRFKYKRDLIESLEHDGFKVSYTYDKEGRRTSISVNDENYVTTDYNDNFTLQEANVYYGNKVTNTYANEHVESFIYDKEGYLKREYRDSSYKTYAYDKYDNVTNVVSNDGYINKGYTYDEYNNLISESDSSRYSKTFTYDTRQRLINETNTYNSKTFNYAFTYNEENKSLLDKVELNIDNKTLNKKLEYDALNRIRVQSLNINNEEFIKDEFEYLCSDDNALSLIKEHIVSFKGNLLETNTYEYDLNGNIIKVVTNEDETRYRYDSLNRLVREDNPLLNKTITYKYDKKGNILLRKEYEYTLEENLLNPCKTDKFTYNKGGWEDQLIKYNDESFIYDNMGRPTIYRGMTASWNKDGTLSNIGNKYSYIRRNFDGMFFERRISATSNNVILTTVDGNKILADNGLTFIYMLEKLIGFIYNGNRYYYQRNIQGDITHIYKEDGTLISKYVYDAYGRHKVLNSSLEEDSDTSSIGNLNPFRYRGYYYDKVLGLYFLTSRYYDPETCRFIFPDSISILDETRISINGLNLYCYCMNNPIMYIDPSGHMPEWLSTTLKIVGGVAIIAGCVIGSIFTGGALSVVLAGAAIGAAAGGIGAGISTAVSGGDIHDFANAFLMSTATGAISGAVAASPLGVGAQIGINAALGATNYAGTQLLSGGNITLGGLIVNAGIGALCGWIGQSGWMQGQTTSAFVAFAGKNALKHVVGMVGTKTLLRMTLPAFLLGGVGGGIYGRLSSQFNPNGNFIGI